MMDQLKQISSSVSGLMQQLSDTEDGKKTSPLDKALESSNLAASIAAVVAMGSVLLNNGGDTPAAAGGAQDNVFGGDSSTNDDYSYNGLGSLSAKYESASAGSSAIGYDKTGGTSYGKYQISSKQGTMDNFLNYVKTENPEIYKRLSAAGPQNTGSTSGAMPDVWRQLAKENAFGNLEHDFIKKTHYDVAMDSIKDPDLRKMIEETPALQDVIWSTAVQHGPSGAASIINKSHTPGISPEEFINNVYDSRGTKFSSSTPAVQRSVKNRFIEERQQALDMLANPPGANSSGAAPLDGVTGNTVSVQPASHKATGSGYTVEGAVDSQGRPVVFGSENAARAFGQMMADSGGKVKGSDVTSSQRSEEKNKSVGGVSGSKHLTGNALDIHGTSGEWIRENGSKYGWKPNDYPGSHGGHFEFSGNIQTLSDNDGPKADLAGSGDTGSNSGAAGDQTQSDILSNFGINFNNINENILTNLDANVNGMNIGEQISSMSDTINNVMPSDVNDIFSQIQSLISKNENNIQPRISVAASEGVESRLPTSPNSGHTNTRPDWANRFFKLFPMSPKQPNRFV
jgi:hypothetical protein